MLVFVPVAVVLEFIHADHITLFIVAAIALVPLAKLIGDSTEHLSTHYGATTGSLLNVTFGNAAEIIIAIVAISAGLLDLVKASITGAIIGNILLIFGLSVVTGGFKFKEQRFNKENVGFQSSMLFLAVIGLAVPTIVSFTMLPGSENEQNIQLLSDSLAIILLVVYVLGIIFTFFTHKHLFSQVDSIQAGGKEEVHATHWSKKKSFLLLAASMVGVIVVSEILVGSVEETGEQLGFGELFVGAIIVGIV